MLAARAMFNRRRERITLNALQPVVESYSGRQFKVLAMSNRPDDIAAASCYRNVLIPLHILIFQMEHVQQIKALYPGAFKWQYIKAPISKEDKQWVGINQCVHKP